MRALQKVSTWWIFVATIGAVWACVEGILFYCLLASAKFVIELCETFESEFQVLI